MSATEPPGLEGLLHRHLPLLRYDSQEPYFADSAAEWTDNPGNELRRADGTVIAAAPPNASPHRLALDFLGASAYGDGEKAETGDRIRDSTKAYADQARGLHAQPKYANRVYGHWAADGDGRAWLAYWFFYFYNDYNLVGPLLPAGLHEGDWEMIQLRLDEQLSAPDLAVYAQHAAAEARAWKDVQRVGDQPVVYPARGSHACYFDTGFLDTGIHQTPAKWFDYANGKRKAPQLSLEVVVDGDPAYDWISWPGMWGGTEPSHGLDGEIAAKLGIADSSPRGPGRHDQWQDPKRLLEKAGDVGALKVSTASLQAAVPPTPTVAIARDGRSLRIDYSSRAEIAQLVVTLNSPQQPLPPAAHRVPVQHPQGTVEVDADLHDEWTYDVHVSASAPDGQSSVSVELPLPAVPSAIR
ncbi:MAG TPA: hypothetical protein VHW67_03845 [Solirubrobacteraceae bacterium]|jgi:hypothetical protein|nr:hypothetical protein [Solirubrobacteraceae bacterium]